jgi:hypothetical protein
MIGNGQLAGSCPPFSLKESFLNEKATSDDIINYFFIKKLFFLLKKACWGRQVGPNYHFPYLRKSVKSFQKLK